jgi:ubiquinone/menaquinone biosynthesis C-methylase UbiE
MEGIKMEKGQQEFYEDTWREAELDNMPNRSGWRSTKPAQDFLDFVETIKNERPGENALDLGCGNGRHAIVLAKNGFEVFGLDFSENAINLAKQNAKQNNVSIGFTVGDALDLPYKDAFFDLINDDGCLHHISRDNQAEYIENVARVLRENGIMRIKVFSDNSQNLDRDNQWAYSKSSGLTYFFIEEEVRNLFSEQFEIIDLKEISHEVAGDKRFLVAIMRRRKND